MADIQVAAQAASAAYRTWISSFAAGIGTKPAVVVIEPDALGDFACMTQAQIDERLGMLVYATQMFQQKSPNTYAYLDGGNAGWVAAGTMASRLNSAGVRNVRGFSVNVSNYYTTSQSTSYANSVVGTLGFTARFVVDTSRNANGPTVSGATPPVASSGSPPRWVVARRCCCGSRLLVCRTGTAVSPPTPRPVSSTLTSPPV